MTSILTAEPATVTVKPWVQMSDDEKARHLVYGHGFDVDLFAFSPDTDRLYPDNEAVRVAFIQAETDPAFRARIEQAAGGASYPHGMTAWHESDHNGDGTTLAGDFADCGMNPKHIHKEAEPA